MWAERFTYSSHVYTVTGTLILAKSCFGEKEQHLLDQTTLQKIINLVLFMKKCVLH